MDDPRTTLARADLAPADREGLDPATRYDEARTFRVVAPVSPMRREPDPSAEQVDQLLHGEMFTVMKAVMGFAWGQSTRSGYVGWTRHDALSPDRVEVTHRVAVLRTIVLAEPKVRAPAIEALSLNALVRVEHLDGAFSRLAGIGWAPTAHLARIGLEHAGVVQTARRFLGVPYAWGGKDSFGIDCSGLVQQAFWSSGMACPRDADQQARLGRAVKREDLAAGDLVCWPGHIAMMLDGDSIIHANAHHMAVAIESLDQAITRIGVSVGAPSAFRRVEAAIARRPTRPMRKP